MLCRSAHLFNMLSTASRSCSARSACCAPGALAGARARRMQTRLPLAGRSAITRLDGGGTEMEQRLPLTGRAMMRLVHAWADGPSGARLRSVLQLGAAAGAVHMPPLRVRPRLTYAHGLFACCVHPTMHALPILPARPPCLTALRKALLNGHTGGRPNVVALTVGGGCLHARRPHATQGVHAVFTWVRKCHTCSRGCWAASGLLRRRAVGGAGSRQAGPLLGAALRGGVWQPGEFSARPVSCSAQRPSLGASTRVRHVEQPCRGVCGWG
jgi:hypothetical protein